MSKGSKPRIADRKSFNKNFDEIKTRKVEGFVQKKGKQTKKY